MCSLTLVNELPHLSMCYTYNGFSLIWLNSSCPNPEYDQVSTLNLQLPALEGCLMLLESSRISHSQGIGLQLLIFKTPTVRVAPGVRLLSEDIQSQRRLLIWFLLFVLMSSTEEVYSQNAFHFGGADKANFIISVHRQNYGLCSVSDGKCAF